MMSKTIIKDGVVNNEEWKKAKPRILWLLKEAYGDGWNKKGEESYTEWIRDTLSKSDLKHFPTLRIVALVSMMLQQNDSYENIFKKERIEIANSLDKISLRNINKSPAKSNSSDGSWLKSFGDGKNIYKEIKKDNPQIVIGGYTLWSFYENENSFLFPELKFKINKPFKYTWWFMHENILFIDAYHPNRRIRNLTNEKYCNEIYSIYTEHFKK